MLPVSDLIEIARSGRSETQLRQASPLRYGDTGESAPVVVWNVCMHCNMRCPHCYAAAVSEPSPTDLDTGEALALIQELALAGVRVLIFSGGEPLLRGDLFTLIERARDLGISPQLSTNGVLIDAAVARRLARAGVAYAGVSIDGLRDFNDDYRGLSGGYDAALQGLVHAKAAGLRTGLRMTLTDRNREQLEAMVALAGSVDCDRLYISHLVYSGRGFQVAKDDLSRSRARAALRELFGIADSLLDDGSALRVVTGSNDSDGPFLLRWLEARYGGEATRPVRRLLLERGGNSAGEKLLNIDSRGRVHPDQFWRAAVLGDVREQSFSTILNHPLRGQLRERLAHLKGRCAACLDRDLCRGSHRERALARYRDPWAPDPACVMEDAEIGIDAGSRAADVDTRALENA
jgi:radical SAM protein with 4Fe4S-binding SPASM domain